MFRRFVTQPNNQNNNPNVPNSDPSVPINREKANELFRLNPVELAGLLELAWDLREWELDPMNPEKSQHPLGHPNRRSDISGLPRYFLDNLFGGAVDKENRFVFATNRERFCTSDTPNEGIIAQNPNCSNRWDHLIYAYLIENTRIYEIFRRVIYEYRHSEKLGVPLASSQHWLRNTEELFFRDAAPFTIYSVTSYVRPDSGASRRNAYYRMFGMDLNHGIGDGKPYPYIKPDTANREFVSTWENFLQEVWIGIVNSRNTIGVDPTDDAAIANLARRLHDMLRTRRTNGNLSREEFWFVSMMSWFHLSVEFDSPIVVSLRAEGSRDEERLKKIAERVKLPAHAKSYYFFRLCDPMSRILTQIETGIYNDEMAVPALYSQGSPVEADMRRIITFWSFATGRNMKAKAVPVTTATVVR